MLSTALLCEARTFLSDFSPQPSSQPIRDKDTPEILANLAKVQVEKSTLEASFSQGELGAI